MLSPTLMKSRRLLVLALITGMATSACGMFQSRSTGTQPPRTGAEASSSAPSLRFRLGFTDGYAAQAVVERYTRESIHHVLIRLFELEATDPPGGPGSGTGLPPNEIPILDESQNPITATLYQGDLGSEIRFSELRFGKGYRVRAYAYKAPTASEENLISESDSYFDTGVGVSGSMRVLVVHLKGTVFSGSSGGESIAYEEGQTITFDAPDISVPEPDPSDPPGTIIVEPLPDSSAVEWQWGDEEYGNE